MLGVGWIRRWEDEERSGGEGGRWRGGAGRGDGWVVEPGAGRGGAGPARRGSDTTDCRSLTKCIFSET